MKLLAMLAAPLLGVLFGALFEAVSRLIALRSLPAWAPAVFVTAVPCLGVVAYLAGLGSPAVWFVVVSALATGAAVLRADVLRGAPDSRTVGDAVSEHAPRGAVTWSLLGSRLSRVPLLHVKGALAAALVITTALLILALMRRGW